MFGLAARRCSPLEPEENATEAVAARISRRVRIEGFAMADESAN